MDYAIWTEKYRPRDFSEIKGHREIVGRVKAFVEKKNMPHLLFSGPAGVGKTTLALVIARKLFGDCWNQNFLELNASDERGIDTIRERVKDFARTRAIGDVPFKILYLDECDALTKDAQNALRRTMENYTQTCRFILSCNYSSKIIDPIQSRCTIFRFKQLEEKDMKDFIHSIVEKEDAFKYTKKTDANYGKIVDAVYEVSGGDVRRALNILQSCSAVAEDMNVKDINESLIYSMASIAKPKEVKEILELALKNKFIESREKLLDIMLKYGISGIDIVKQIERELWNLDIDGRSKMTLIEKCGEIEFRMVEGSDEFLQAEALLANVALVGAKK